MDEPRTSIETAHRPEPNISQNRLPCIRIKTNMKAMADKSFTTPKIPVKKRDEDTDVNPADMKMTGASVTRFSNISNSSKATKTYNNSVRSVPPYFERSSIQFLLPTFVSHSFSLILCKGPADFPP